MQLFKLKEQKILYNYLKQNVGWLCLDPLVKKKCNVGWWLHRFLFSNSNLLLKKRTFIFVSDNCSRSENVGNSFKYEVFML